MPRKPPFTEDQLRLAISAARSWAEAARLLGYRVAGGNVQTVRRHASRLRIPTGHFDPRAAQREAAGRKRGPKRALEDILVVGSRVSRGHLKERLYGAGLKPRRCEVCGQREIWNGRRMSLILDHINGNGEDNRIENLRIVCPNCDATLETYCGRKLPRERICAGCGTSFEPRHLRHRYCSLECFNGMRLAAAGAPNSASVYGRPQHGLRKVKRPTLHRLLRDVDELGFLAVGRMYGVSDNAIRKWIRWHCREIERAVADGAAKLEDEVWLKLSRRPEIRRVRVIPYEKAGRA